MTSKLTPDQFSGWARLYGWDNAKVVQAYHEGKPIEFRIVGKESCSEWFDMVAGRARPEWYFSGKQKYQYRIKEQA